MGTLSLSGVSSNPRLTRSQLESLSTEELNRTAEQFGIDISENVKRSIIIEELLELARDGETGREETPAGRMFQETTTLPCHYNSSYIEVMIRDPLWAFVFWEIKTLLKEEYEKSPDFEGYFLRVIPLNEHNTPASRDGLFTIAVGVNDNAWYLGFSAADALPTPAREALSAFERTRQGVAAGTPMPVHTGHYRVELCLRQDEKLILLAVSRPFIMPRLVESKMNESSLSESVDKSTTGSESIQVVYKNPMAVLSGVSDFSLIRSVNRQSRVRGS